MLTSFRFRFPRHEQSALLFVAVLASCGGNVTVDGTPDGTETATSGTSTSSTTETTTTPTGTTTTTPTTTTTTTTKPSCEQLTDAFQKALAEARACDVCEGPEKCEYYYGQPLGDVCGCPVNISTKEPEVVQAAVEAYGAWTAAGCGPYDCGEMCGFATQPKCAAYGNCVGNCAP